MRKICELCSKPVQRTSSPYCEPCIMASFNSDKLRELWCALSDEDKMPFDAHWLRVNGTIFLDMDFMIGLLVNPVIHANDAGSKTDAA